MLPVTVGVFSERMKQLRRIGAAEAPDESDRRHDEQKYESDDEPRHDPVQNHREFHPDDERRTKHRWRPYPRSTH